MNRIVGLETEYGCLTNTPAGSFIAVERVRDWIFGREEYGLIDVHHRDWDEPPGNGGFLFNGGRGYIDNGPPGYFTPEGPSLLVVLPYQCARGPPAVQAGLGPGPRRVGRASPPAACPSTTAPPCGP